MDDLTRRAVAQRFVAMGMLATVGAEAPQERAAEDGFDPAEEKRRVMEVGMTGAEADAWIATAEAAGKFFALPELHPMDKQEVATAIHIIQNKLLGRPAYRKYTRRTEKE